MKKIVIGATEIEVLNLNAYVYDGGRGEKVLRIDISADSIDFGALRDMLEGNTEPIQYFEDDALKCEYTGYDKFEAQYKGNLYKVELHMASVGTQMVLLVAANERIIAENAIITEENARITTENEQLKENNEVLFSAVSVLQNENEQIKGDNASLASAVGVLQQENDALKKQVENINVDNEVINTMLGLED